MSYPRGNAASATGNSRSTVRKEKRASFKAVPNSSCDSFATFRSNFDESRAACVALRDSPSPITYFFRKAALVQLVANWEGFVQDILREAADIYFESNSEATKDFFVKHFALLPPLSVTTEMEMCALDDTKSVVQSLFIKDSTRVAYIETALKSALSKKIKDLGNPTFGEIKAICKDIFNVELFSSPTVFDNNVIQLRVSEDSLELKTFRVTNSRSIGLMVLFFYGIRCVMAHGKADKTLSEGVLKVFSDEYLSELAEFPEIRDWCTSLLGDLSRGHSFVDLQYIVLFNCNRVLAFAALALKTSLGVLLSRKLGREIWQCNSLTKISGGSEENPSPELAEMTL